MTTGDPTHEKSGRPSVRKRAVCGYVRPRPRRRRGARALSFSSVTQLRPPPVCTGRGVGPRAEWEPPPLRASLLLSTRPLGRLLDGLLPLHYEGDRAFGVVVAWFDKKRSRLIQNFAREALQVDCGHRDGFGAACRSQWRESSWRTSSWVASPRLYSTADPTHFFPPPVMGCGETLGPDLRFSFWCVAPLRERVPNFVPAAC